MNILITGGMGFIGSHLSEFLTKKKYNITCLDLFEEDSLHYLRDFDNFNLVIDSILNKEIIEKLVKANDLIIHLAGIAEPEQYVKYPRKTIEVNLKASLNIIDSIATTEKKLFFSSTSEVYGKNTNIPFYENSDRVLGSSNINRWSYASSKSMIEHYLYSLSSEKLINFDGIRIFNCYGPRLKGRVVSKFIEKIKLNEVLQIHGDGTQKRCYTYIEDVIDGVVKIIEKKSFSNDFYNIGNPLEEHSIHDLILVLKKILKKNKINFEYLKRNYYGSSYEDPDRRVPDITKIKKYINWSPKINLKTGLLKTLKYYDLTT